MGRRQFSVAFVMGIGAWSAFLMSTGQGHAASCDLETYLIWSGLGSPAICDNHAELETARHKKNRQDTNRRDEQQPDYNIALETLKSTDISEEAPSKHVQYSSPQIDADVSFVGRPRSVFLDKDTSKEQPAILIEPILSERQSHAAYDEPLARSYFVGIFGGGGSQDARLGEPSSNMRIGGATGGVDLYTDDRLRLGLIGMYAHIHVDVNENQETVDIISPKIGAQASMEFGNWHLENIVLYGPEISSASRVTSVSGAEQHLTNNYTNHRVTQAFELGYTERFGSMVVQPIAGIELDWHYQAKAAERGVQSSAAWIKRSSHWEGETKLGLTLSTEAMIGNISVVPTISASWRHRFGKLSNTVSMSFDSGLTYERVGTAPVRDLAEIQASLGFNLKPDMVLNIGYSGRFNSVERLHSGSIGLRVEF